jgi:hypothetical protein
VGLEPGQVLICSDPHKFLSSAGQRRLDVRAHDAPLKKLVVQPKPSTRKITDDQVSPNEFISSGVRLSEQNMESQLRTVHRRLCVKANCDGNPPPKYCLATVQVEGAREWYCFTAKPCSVLAISLPNSAVCGEANQASDPVL